MSTRFGHGLGVRLVLPIFVFGSLACRTIFALDRPVTSCVVIAKMSTSVSDLIDCHLARPDCTELFPYPVLSPGEELGPLRTNLGQRVSG